MTAIVGLDLSLTATGISCADHTDTIRPPKDYRGVDRLEWLRSEIVGHLTAGNGLVVLEGYSYASANQAHQVGELGGVVRLTLRRLDIPWVVIPPSSLKKFATGKGGAAKDAMVAAAARLGCPADDNNAVDAWWLRQLGLYALVAAGYDGVPHTAYRDEAVAKIEWPEWQKEAVA